ncbi:enoyl-CoA hydratase [Oceanobacillus kimchii]|uniref:enoyl-CoA hydratase n=1 Tax=Oceanobacillus kimchii TaxID=746691 RepID=UPI0021A948ED|nr:enoyl-CoA hydratase [Oceanobacillus kimchii]MCT1575637.1 enoyl-CoA hydratase [Oceanobacillus kimchii]MCT2137268.1 enoyl-CoA hydratase [Oceanobacillus kimchii]
MTKIAFELKDQVACLTIQSPPANALSGALLEQLNERLNQIEEEGKAKAVVISGEGRFFSAGADIKEFTGYQHASEYESLATAGQKVFDRVEHFSIPVIAAIHGAALGGGLELAMSCHIRLVTENTKLGLPEMNLGIIPGFAGTQRLPRHIGNARAYEMILTGEPISGQQAADWGLVNHVVTEEQLLSKAMELANKITMKSKPGINEVMHLVPYANKDQFANGVTEEAKSFGRLFGSDDAKEGVTAFIEKRRPNFQDK